MIWQTFAVIAAGYAIGGIPSTYLVGRFLKGVDIRASGSGNVGASNLSEHVGRWIAIPVGLFDAFGKVTLPILAAGFLVESLAAQAAVGAAALLAHNWSPYLKFAGGRGVSPALGILFAFELWFEVALGLFVIGVVGMLILKDMALWTFIMILALPALGLAFGREPEIVALLGCAAFLMLVKRLVGNGVWSNEKDERWRVYVYRLLWDRDVAHGEEWTRRGIE